jgi:hypothetical protein
LAQEAAQAQAKAQAKAKIRPLLEVPQASVNLRGKPKIALAQSVIRIGLFFNRFAKDHSDG